MVCLFISAFPQTAKHWGSNLRYREWESVTPVFSACLPVSQSLRSSLFGQMPDAVTLAPGSCLPLVSLCLAVSATLLRGRVSRLSPCVSQFLRSEARCCVSLCLPVSAVRGQMLCVPVSASLCGQMPDAVTLAPGSFLPVSLCLAPTSSNVSLCLAIAGSGVVSPACLPQFLRSETSPLVSLCLPGQMPDAATPAPGSCL